MDKVNPETTSLAIDALTLVRDDPEAANAAIGKMRDAIIAAGMMIPPLIDIDSNQMLFLTDLGRRALEGQEP